MLSRLKQFSAMNKLKKMALRVCILYYNTNSNSSIVLLGPPVTEIHILLKLLAGHRAKYDHEK